ARRLDPHGPRPAAGELRDHDRLAGPQPLDLVRVDDELLDASACAAARARAAQQVAPELTGHLPDLLGAGDLRDRVRGLGHFLTVSDLDRGDAEHLIA